MIFCVTISIVRHKNIIKMLSHTNFSGNQANSLINPELIDLLKTIRPTTVLGTSIYMAFAGNYDKSLLLNELKALAKDNPGCMRKIIGNRAFDLLVSAPEKLAVKASNE